jgi:putative transposase
VKGRKRHLLVDTLGLILHVLVHEATIQDQERANSSWSGSRAACLDSSSSGLIVGTREAALRRGESATLGWDVEIVEHSWCTKFWLRVDTNIFTGILVQMLQE